MIPGYKSHKNELLPLPRGQQPAHQELVDGHDNVIQHAQPQEPKIDDEPERFQLHVGAEQNFRQNAHHYPGAVQRGDGYEIEDAKDEVGGAEKKQEQRRQLGERRHEAENNRAYYGRRKIRQGARRSHDHYPAARVFEIARIERHRLGPPEQNRAVDQHQHHGKQDRAENVEVGQRVQGKAVRALGGRIAQHVGGIAVGHLVYHHGQGCKELCVDWRRQDNEQGKG